jgi:hypothetical protein
MIALTGGMKLLGGGLAAVLVVSAGVWAGGRAIRSAVRDEIKVALLDTGREKLDSVRVVHDSGYRVDTLILRNSTSAYHPLAEAARRTPTDTATVRRALNAADTAIKACLVVVASCEQRVKDRDAIIANRDSLVVELRKPKPDPRLSYDVAGLYDPLKGESILRSGAELRVLFNFRGRVEAEYSIVKGFGARVGVRKVF